MPPKKTYKTAGLFVIIGLLCLAAIIFNYVGKQYFTDKNNLAVMYFDESVRGLSVGSSVVLQGVAIGQVDKISLIADLQAGTFKAPVFVLFDGKKISSYQNGNKLSGRKLLDHLIKKGLKARLISANYLTGQLMVELFMAPDEPGILRGDGKYCEIPTELSTFARFSKDLQEIPLHESLTRLGDVLVHLDNSLPDILKNTQQLTSRLDNILQKKANEFSQTFGNVNSTLEEITKASRSIKNLTDYLERHPEAILTGKEK